MNNYNPEIHHRRSIRLKGYDYSSIGSYFITICAQNRENLFGDVIDNKMVLNNAGEMVKKWVIETENKFKNISIDEYIIMPNHFHSIMSILNVGADLRVCPNDENICPNDKNICPNDENICPNDNPGYKGEHTGSPQPKIEIPEIVQWFKTMTTNEYIKGIKNGIYLPFDKRIWQHNYYERIIRNETEFNKIKEYIINNPVNWLNDKNNIEIRANEVEKILEEVV